MNKLKYLFLSFTLFSLQGVSAMTFIEISSDTAEILLSKNQHTFIGNVQLKSEDDFISAHKLIIIKADNITKFKAFGKADKLVEFNIKGSTGKGQRLEYDDNSNIITITKSASLLSEGSILKAEKIIYNIDTQTIISGDNNGRVFMRINQ